jgi:hypothetical protein
MSAKFIKCQDVIVNTNDIKSVSVNGQYLTIKCTDEDYDIYFSTEAYAMDELNRIYSILKTC